MALALGLLGISGRNKAGFSPWGMLSYPGLNLHIVSYESPYPKQ